MVYEVKSQAVVEYMGRRDGSFPTVNPEAVLGMNVSNSELVVCAEGLVAEMLELFPLGWRGERGDLGLGQAMEIVGVTMRDRCPELDLEAAGALAWTWGCSAGK